jgi:hypothetical protein
METKTNVALVHGAWADGSSWSRVIPLLQKKGLNVVAAQLPLTSIDADVGVTKNLLAALTGPVVLSRNFHSLTRESTALVLLFCEFIGMKAAHLTRIEHTTARRLSHAFRTGGRP